MLHFVVRLPIALAAAIFTTEAVPFLTGFLLGPEWRSALTPLWYMVSAAAGLAAGYALGGWAWLVCTRLVERVVASIQARPGGEIVSGTVGLTAGLLIACLVALPLPETLPGFGRYLPLFISLICGYIGLMVGVRKREDLLSWWDQGRGQVAGLVAGPTAGFNGGYAARNMNGTSGTDQSVQSTHGHVKIIDTNVIIDGRIADLCRTGFIEGTLVVPSFVLHELQHIADSSDILRRNRGRRGLDILNRMRKEATAPVQVLSQDYEEVAGVDAKLILLAKEIGGAIITNDYNLNKVAELQGVTVLNINELANALKPVALPGEEMLVQVIKDGKEQGQGVGYLDDGTMVVVEGGRRHLGETLDVVVTSVLQTAAGRMIFAKPKALERAL